MTQEKDIKKTEELSREELSNVAGGTDTAPGGHPQWGPKGHPQWGAKLIPSDDQNEQPEAALI